MQISKRFALTQKTVVNSLLVFFLLSYISSAQAAPRVEPVTTKNFDLVVYGGTPSGVVAAIAAERQGLKVALVAEGKTVGGSISNGLGATDLRQPKIMGAIPLEFFKAVKAASNNPDSWRVTPKRAEDIFRNMLTDAGVDVFYNFNIAKATVSNNKINCITDESGAGFCGAEFIDSSYMGDLLPLTNTAFNLGRKDLFAYGDDKAMPSAVGVRLSLPKNMTLEEKTSIESLPFMKHPTTFDPETTKVTNGMPSFTYRFCLSNGEKKRALKIWPEDKQYVPAWRLIAKSFYKEGCPNCENSAKRKLTKFWRIARVSGDKWDLNSLNSFTNFPIPDDYFTNEASRPAYNLQAAHYIESLVAYLQSEEGPIKQEQQILQGFGMCSDEFVDNNNIPYQPYIREGRRLVGKSTLLVTSELNGDSFSDSIGMAQFPADNKLSISVQYGNQLFRDYTFFANTKVYEIPFSITIPKSGPSNLLVSVAVSTSPLAYGSLRMEPHFMSIGQATGVAAALAVKNDTSVADVPIKSLKAVLSALGQKLHLSALEKPLGN